MKPDSDGRGYFLPINPVGSTRARTSLIFVVGLLLLIGATSSVSLVMTNLIHQAEIVITHLDRFDAQAVEWTDQALTAPGGALSATEYTALLTKLRTEAQPGPENYLALRLLSRSEADFASAITSTERAWQSYQRAYAALAGDPQSMARREDLLRASAHLRETLEDAARVKWLEHQSNTGMVRGLFGALFFSSLIFLLVGLWFTQQIVISQVETLDQVAQRITAGDLDTPVVLGGQGEFLDLARSFETMRVELRDSRLRFQQWTSELEAHVARRTQELSALSQVIAVASRTLEPGAMLRAGLEQALSVLGVETGGIWLVDEASGGLALNVACGMPPALEQRARLLERGDGAAWRAADSGLTIVYEDIAQLPAVITASAIQEGFRGTVAAPIKMRERVTGVLAVMTRTTRSFAPDEIALLTSIAQQIGIALDSLRLTSEVRQQTQRVAALQERERIGIELHDGVLQTLGYLCLKIDQLEAEAVAHGMTVLAQELVAQRAVLETASRDVRRFIANLRETEPPPAPLQAALKAMAAEFEQEHSLHVIMDLKEPPLLLAADQSAHLVRIAREALVNAHRHGQALQARVRCARVKGHGYLSVCDDGAGFDATNAPPDGRDHFGLSVMRARAARVGGELTIRSAPGQGACVEVVWPLEPA